MLRKVEATSEQYKKNHPKINKDVPVENSAKIQTKINIKYDPQKESFVFSQKNNNHTAEITSIDLKKLSKEDLIALITKNKEIKFDKQELALKIDELKKIISEEKNGHFLSARLSAGLYKFVNTNIVLKITKDEFSLATLDKSGEIVAQTKKFSNTNYPVDELKNLKIINGNEALLAQIEAALNLEKTLDELVSDFELNINQRVNSEFFYGEKQKLIDLIKQNLIVPLAIGKIEATQKTKLVEALKEKNILADQRDASILVKGFDEKVLSVLGGYFKKSGLEKVEAEINKTIEKILTGFIIENKQNCLLPLGKLDELKKEIISAGKFTFIDDAELLKTAVLEQSQKFGQDYDKQDLLAITNKSDFARIHSFLEKVIDQEMNRPYYEDAASRNSDILKNGKGIYSAADIVKDFRFIDFSAGEHSAKFSVNNVINVIREKWRSYPYISTFFMGVVAMTAVIPVFTPSLVFIFSSFLAYAGAAFCYNYFWPQEKYLRKNNYEVLEKPLHNAKQVFKLDQEILKDIELADNSSLQEFLVKNFAKEKADVYFNSASGELSVDYRAAERFETLDEALRSAIGVLQQKKAEQNGDFSKNSAYQKQLSMVNNLQLFLRQIVPVGNRTIAMADHFFIKIDKAQLPANFINTKGIFISASDNSKHLSQDEVLVQINHWAKKEEFDNLMQSIEDVDTAHALRFAYTITHRYKSEYKQEFASKVASVKAKIAELKAKPKASLLTYFTYGGPAGAFLQDLYASTENMLSFPIQELLTVNMDGRNPAFLYETIGKLTNVRTIDARRNILLSKFGDELNKVLEERAQGSNKSVNVFMLALLLGDTMGRDRSGISLSHISMMEALGAAFPADGISRSNMNDLLHRLDILNVHQGLENYTYDLNGQEISLDLDNTKMSRTEFIENMKLLLKDADKKIFAKTKIHKITPDTLTEFDLENFAGIYYDYYSWVKKDEPQIANIVRELTYKSADLEDADREKNLDELAALLGKRFAIASNEGLKKSLSSIYSKDNVAETERSVAYLIGHNNYEGERDKETWDNMDYLKNVSEDLFWQTWSLTAQFTHNDEGHEDAFISQNEFISDMADFAGELGSAIKEIDQEMIKKITSFTGEKDIKDIAAHKVKKGEESGKGGIYTFIRRKIEDSLNDSVKEMPLYSAYIAFIAYKKWMENFYELREGEKKEHINEQAGHNIYQKAESFFDKKLESCNLEFLNNEEFTKELNELFPKNEKNEKLKSEILQVFQENQAAIWAEVEGALSGMFDYRLAQTKGLINWLGGQKASLDKLSGQDFFKENDGFSEIVKERLKEYSKVKDKAADVDKKLSDLINQLTKTNGFKNGSCNGFLMNAATAQAKLEEFFKTRVINDSAEQKYITAKFRDQGYVGYGEDDPILEQEFVVARAEEIDFPLNFKGNAGVESLLADKGLLYEVKDKKDEYKYKCLKFGWRKKLSASEQQNVEKFLNEQLEQYKTKFADIVNYYEERAELRELLYAYVENNLGIKRREAAYQIIADILDNKDKTLKNIIDAKLDKGKWSGTVNDFVFRSIRVDANEIPGDEPGEKFDKQIKLVIDKYIAEIDDAKENFDFTDKAQEKYDGLDLSFIRYYRHVPDISQRNKPNNTNAYLLGENLSDQLKRMLLTLIEENKKWPGLSVKATFEKMRKDYFEASDKAVDMKIKVERGKTFKFFDQIDEYAEILNKLFDDLKDLKDSDPKIILETLKSKIEKDLQAEKNKILRKKDLDEKALAEINDKLSTFYRIFYATDTVKDRNNVGCYSNADKDNFFYSFFTDVLSYGWGINKDGELTKNKYTIIFQGPQDFTYQVKVHNGKRSANMLQKAAVVDMDDAQDRVFAEEGEQGLQPPTGCGGWRQNYMVRINALYDITDIKSPDKVLVEEIVAKLKYYIAIGDYQSAKTEVIDKYLSAEYKKEVGQKNKNKITEEDKAYIQKIAGMNNNEIESLGNEIIKRNNRKFLKRFLALNLISVGVVLTVPFAAPAWGLVILANVLLFGSTLRVADRANTVSSVLRMGSEMLIKGILAFGVIAGAVQLFSLAGLISLALFQPFLIVAILASFGVTFSFLNKFSLVDLVNKIFKDKEDNVLFLGRTQVRLETERGDSAVEDQAASLGIMMSHHNGERVPTSGFYADAEGDYLTAKGQFQRWFAATVELLARTERDRVLAKNRQKLQDLHHAIYEKHKEVMHTKTLQYSFPLISMPQSIFFAVLSGFCLLAIPAFAFYPILGISMIVPMTMLSSFSVVAYAQLMRLINRFRYQMGYSLSDGKASLARMAVITTELIATLARIICEKIKLPFNVTKPVDPPIRQRIAHEIAKRARAINVAIFAGLARLGLAAVPLMFGTLPITIPFLLDLAVASFVVSLFVSKPDNSTDKGDKIRLSLVWRTGLRAGAIVGGATGAGMLFAGGFSPFFTALGLAGLLASYLLPPLFKASPFKLKESISNNLRDQFSKFNENANELKEFLFANLEKTVEKLEQGASVKIIAPAVAASAVVGSFFMPLVGIVASGIVVLFWALNTFFSIRNTTNFVEQIPGVLDDISIREKVKAVYKKIEGGE